MSLRLMVLGAGFEHVALIRRARALGHHVISVDNVPQNVGHAYSDEQVDVSTVDREAVLDAARKHRIDGILTIASDVAVPSVAHVAESLGLPGPSRETAGLLSHKVRFRSFQSWHGHAHPRFVSGTDEQQLAPAREFRPSVVFKPADSSGSKGVSQVDGGERAAWKRAFESARAHSQSGVVCVEEFVPGTSFSGDAFLIDGVVRAAVLTRKTSRGLVPTGHSLPGELTADEQARVVECVGKLADDAGYREGPLDFDAVLGANGATVIEMSPRLGGNSIPLLIERATGLDLIGLHIRSALGTSVRVPPFLAVTRPCGVLLFGSDRAGRLVAIAGEDELQSAFPGVFGFTLKYRVGDRVPRFDHSGHSLGWVLFDLPGEYAAAAAELQNALRLEVD